MNNHQAKTRSNKFIIIILFTIMVTIILTILAILLRIDTTLSLINKSDKPSDMIDQLITDQQNEQPPIQPTQNSMTDEEQEKIYHFLQQLKNDFSWIFADAIITHGNLDWQIPTTKFNDNSEFILETKNLSAYSLETTWDNRTGIYPSIEIGNYLTKSGFRDAKFNWDGMNIIGYQTPDTVCLISLPDESTEIINKKIILSCAVSPQLDAQLQLSDYQAKNILQQIKQLFTTLNFSAIEAGEIEAYAANEQGAVEMGKLSGWKITTA